MLDIFNNDAFGVVKLTDAINDMKYRPSRIGALGLFRPTSVSATSIAIERIGDILQLVKPSPRGGPGETTDTPKRTLRNFSIPHFQRDWAVMADEVQNVRAFGSETVLKTVQGVVAEKLAYNIADFALTEEHARLGAVTGNIVYADGSNLNLFNEFGVVQAAEIDLGLQVAVADQVDGAFLETCTKIIRLMKKQLGGTSFDHVHCFCDDKTFDAVLKLKEVRDTYKGWSEAQILRESYVGKNRGENPIFEYGGIVWENYGEVDGEGVGVAEDKAHFFPIGVPNLFRTYYGPADYMETVNTLGRRLYSKQWRMPNDKGINGETQTNALQLCTRPKALLKGHR
jgi:hypothetical protein